MEINSYPAAEASTGKQRRYSPRKKSCTKLRITETPAHFGTIEMVAVHSEYDVLYLIALFHVPERHFYTLPFHAGNKHASITVPASFRFVHIVKLVLCLVRPFHTVTLDILFTICHVYSSVVSRLAMLQHNESNK